MLDVGCDVCGADIAETYAIRPPRADVLHTRFVRCAKCGFIYANPRATPEEARRFYEAMSSRGSGSLSVSVNSRAWERAVQSRRRHLERALPLVTRPRPVQFLELGFGDGSALAAARELGWEPHGLEYANWLVIAARDRLGIDAVTHGGLEDAGFDDESFDVVYSWHVVEHVPDIDVWLSDIARLLRPGGVLILGTENSDCVYGTIWCGVFKLLGRVPWPPTSADHTYWFSRRSLVALVSRHGLEPVEVKAYENDPFEIVRGESLSRLRNPRWAASLTIYLLSSVVSVVIPRLGGKLWLVAVKTP